MKVSFSYFYHTVGTKISDVAISKDFLVHEAMI